MVLILYVPKKKMKNDKLKLRTVDGKLISSFCSETHQIFVEANNSKVECEKYFNCLNDCDYLIRADKGNEESCVLDEQLELRVYNLYKEGGFAGSISEQVLLEIFIANFKKCFENFKHKDYYSKGEFPWLNENRLQVLKKTGYEPEQILEVLEYMYELNTYLKKNVFNGWDADFSLMKLKIFFDNGADIDWVAEYYKVLIDVNFSVMAECDLSDQCLVSVGLEDKALELFVNDVTDASQLYEELKASSDELRYWIEDTQELRIEAEEEAEREGVEA